MNFQNLNFDHVERPRVYADQPNFYPRTPSNHSELTVRPFADHLGDRHSDHASSRPASPSPQPTVVPYAPTPPDSSPSAPEIYGPDRLFGPPLVIRNELLEELRFKPQITLDQINQIAFQTQHNTNMASSGFKDELALAAGKVTPGIDDTPFIQDRIQDDRAKVNPKLYFLPRILRPDSMFTLMILCALMILALIFCAVYSQVQDGLWAYNGTIYGGQYFVFRILPGLLASIILLYAQNLMTTQLRLWPLITLNSNHRGNNKNALFMDLYLRSFLWPHKIGSWSKSMPFIVTWLMNFTLPLQSCLFTVIRVDGKWKWATTQGVAWVLVALYGLLFTSTFIQRRVWRNQRTGLAWDPRSIADMIALVSHSNTLADYRGTELLGKREDLQKVLRNRNGDSLSYWGWLDNRPGLWYGIGTAPENYPGYRVDRSRTGQGLNEKDGQFGEKMGNPWDEVDLEGGPLTPSVRYRYLPWCMRTNQLLYFVVAAFVLLVALFVISFLPATRVTRGFLPGLSAAPVAGAFSSADFLYSFIPSLLGLIMFMLFQSLDLNLRILQPWAELAEHSDGGALPKPSILADYAACYPLQSTYRAVQNRHWRLAAISLLSTLFVLLPVLAGGIFMALTARDGVVRMFPNVPLFGFVLALLVLYFLGLVAMLPGRQAFRLPHAVTCLAEIISFCSNEELAADARFKDIRNKTSLEGKLGLDNRPGMQSRWMFGVRSGRDERLGIRPAHRFTEQPAITGTRMSRRDKYRRERVSPQFVFPARAAQTA
ncbi:putative phosphoribosylaminoimidazole-succinocarboxamide synthase protein [Phaeoacremonium minimum UCRPA7]|uniref:Putative phosphoribosylaminoimidazole-succinocarboxamide synthase protein n=1 Tax=Phaeoacremonium minimum (strain UCR-PA7) TaxID=1286976 RepID=R8BHK1_PHAM7|nr:putative phosphoribosylaminoimidazole-succinocarboxamide synthase protein [Phaeoacremonium minimum UCRPA7]EON98793.1 putative phosphoribosylaminoimidazole-succinocarboxamide synthase protein [Phaeoacremonium minimum UCRPA7]